MPLLGRSTANWIIRSGPEAHSRRSRACSVDSAPLGSMLHRAACPRHACPCCSVSRASARARFKSANAFPAATPNAATASFAQPACNARRAVAVPAGRLRPVRCAAACAAPRIESAQVATPASIPNISRIAATARSAPRGRRASNQQAACTQQGSAGANSRIPADRARTTADWQVAPRVVV